ncbi:MAG TPA: hypothetical protein DEQ43_17500 [Nocardioides bacterium]|nr:hypothetical protein [Nocardioides sp.]
MLISVRRRCSICRMTYAPSAALDCNALAE